LAGCWYIIFQVASQSLVAAQHLLQAIRSRFDLRKSGRRTFRRDKKAPDPGVERFDCRRPFA
jgi:hypothetical protein